MSMSLYGYGYVNDENNIKLFLFRANAFAINAQLVTCIAKMLPTHVNMLTKPIDVYGDIPQLYRPHVKFLTRKHSVHPDVIKKLPLGSLSKSWFSACVELVDAYFDKYPIRHPEDVTVTEAESLSALFDDPTIMVE